MKLCVSGAGAIGGHVAVELALASHDVSVIARGPHLHAIWQAGLYAPVGETGLRAL